MDSLYLITVKKITTIFQKTLTRSYDEKEKFGPRSKTKKKNTDFLCADVLLPPINSGDTTS